MHALAAVRDDIGPQDTGHGRGYLREFTQQFREYESILSPDELQRIGVPGRRAIACVLGGEERRTLFCLSAATSHEELRQRKSSARIDVVEVEVAGAGNP